MGHLRGRRGRASACHSSVTLCLQHVPAINSHLTAFTAQRTAQHTITTLPATVAGTFQEGTTLCSEQRYQRGGLDQTKHTAISRVGARSNEPFTERARNGASFGGRRATSSRFVRHQSVVPYEARVRDSPKESFSANKYVKKPCIS